MMLRIYSVYDVKAMAYAPPFHVVTNGIAVRMFQELANDPNTTVGRHPADFKLYCVGTFEDQAGLVLGISPPEFVVDAITLVTAQPRLPLEEAAE